MRHFAPIALLATSLLILSGCAGGDAPSREQVPFGLAIRPRTGFGPWYIAQEKGWFEEEGINIKLVKMDRDDAVSFAALGNFDGLNSSIDDWLALQQETGLELVFLEDVSKSADAIIGAPGVRNVAGLDGARVALEPQGPSDLLLSYATTLSGVPLSNVERVPIDASDAPESLASGAVDAVVTNEPFVSQTLATVPGSTVLYSAGQASGLVSDGLVVDPDYADAHPGVVRALARVWEKSVAYLALNPDEGRAIIGEALGIPEDQQAHMLDGLEFWTLKQSLDGLGEKGAFRADTLPLINDTMIAAGTLSADTSIPLDKIDTSAIRAVIDG